MFWQTCRRLELLSDLVLIISNTLWIWRRTNGAVSFMLSADGPPQALEVWQLVSFLQASVWGSQSRLGFSFLPRVTFALQKDVSSSKTSIFGRGRVSAGLRHLKQSVSQPHESGVWNRATEQVRPGRSEKLSGSQWWSVKQHSTTQTHLRGKADFKAQRGEEASFPRHNQWQREHSWTFPTKTTTILLGMHKLYLLSEAQLFYQNNMAAQSLRLF